MTALAKRTTGAPLSPEEHQQRVEAARASAAARRTGNREADEETRFRDYVREVHAIPMLSAERERDLALRARQGDTRARDELVEAHLRLVTSSARKLAGYGLPSQDMVAAGNVGLIQAAEKFDPDKGTRFVTLALPYIRSAQFRHVLDNWSIVRLGTNRDQRRLFFSLREAKARIGELENVEGKDSAAAIAGRLKVKTSSVVDMEQRLGAKDTRLSTPTGDADDGEDLQSRLAANTPSPEAQMMSAQAAAARSRAMASAMKGLPERERQIIAARWLVEKPPTLQELGERFGISAERVRQLEAQALKRMRAQVAGMEKLAKRQLSEAEIEQRRAAAKARWRNAPKEGKLILYRGYDRKGFWGGEPDATWLSPSRLLADTWARHPHNNPTKAPREQPRVRAFEVDRAQLVDLSDPKTFREYGRWVADRVMPHYRPEKGQASVYNMTPADREHDRATDPKGAKYRQDLRDKKAVQLREMRGAFRGDPRPTWGGADIGDDPLDAIFVSRANRVGQHWDKAQARLREPLNNNSSALREWVRSRGKAGIIDPGAEPKANADGRRGLQYLRHPQALLYDRGILRFLRRVPLKKSTPEAIAAAARATAAPTPAQAKAGNYAKGKVDLHGLPISIETPANAWRIGRSWRTQMPGHYGYVRGTVGADGDQVDVTLGPAAHAPDCPVFIVKQVRPETGAFDEWKCFLGYRTESEAARAYDESFSDGSGPRRRALVRRLTLDGFKDWLAAGGGRLEKRTKGAPLSDAEIEQRREAARARWGATGAGAGLVAGVLVAPAASRAYAERVAQEKNFRPTAERLAQRHAEQRVARLDAALERRRGPGHIGKPFRNVAAEGEWGTRKVDGKTIPSLRGRNQGPVSREVRRLRSAIAQDHARASALMQHLQALDAWFASGHTGPIPVGPNENVARREINAAKDRILRHESQVAELLAARPELDKPRKGGVMRRRQQGFAQRVGQPIGLREDHTAAVPSSLSDRRLKEIRQGLRRHADWQYGKAAQRARARWGDFVPRFEEAVRGRFINTIAGKLRGRARLVTGLAGAALGAGAGYALAKVAPDDGPTEAPDPSAQEAEIARRLAGLFQQWRDNPSRLGNQDDVREAMGPLYSILADAADTLGSDVPPADAGDRRIITSFDARNPEVERRLRDYALDRIRAVTAEVRETIRSVLVDASMRGTPVEEQAREIRDSIGLSPAQKGWVSSYRKQLQSLDPRVLDRALRDRRHDKPIERAIRSGTPLSDAAIERYVDSYHRRALAYRATTIARTEALRGANTGMVESARMMLRDNPDLTVEKTWIATGDDRTRDAHRDLNGKSVFGLDAPFQIRDPKTGAMETIRWPHDDQASAGMVVNCRCTLGIRVLPRPEYGRMTAVAV